MAQGTEGAHAARFEVTIGAKTYQEAGGKIADLVVETTLDGADRFSLTLNVPFDSEHKEFTGLNWDDFATGKPVDVSVGWGDSLEPLFVGHVHQLTTNFSRETGPSVGLSGYGLLHQLMGGTHDRSWSKTTVGDVVSEVLSSYFGDRTVEASGTKREKIYQHDQSDYRFVAELAGRYGYRFFTQRNTVYFTPRSQLGSDDPAIMLGYGGGLDSFSAEVNAANEVKTVEVRHWDMQNEQEIVGSASTDAKNDKKEVFRIPCASTEEADQIAANRLNELSNAAAQAHGETHRGVPQLTAGTTITIEEVGGRFSKNYYVTRATHRVGGSGYRTSFEATEVPE